MTGGRSPLSRAVALTIVATSAFWILFGAWLFHAHVASDEAMSHRIAAEDAGASASRAGALAGLVGPQIGSAPKPGRMGMSEPFSATGAPPAHLTIPVAGVRPGDLVDTFAQAREQGARHHDAIDIMAPEGGAVVAAAPGRVEKLFLSDKGGNTIYVRSPDRRWIYYYAHLAGYAPGLREGLPVRQGDRLGQVGHTGDADAAAPHLHFAIWPADPRLGWYQETPAIDPYPLLGGRPAIVRTAQSKTSD